MLITVALCETSDVHSDNVQSSSDQLNSISILTKQNNNKPDSFNNFNVNNKKDYGYLQFGHNDFMEVNGLADSNPSPQAYYYDRPDIPFDQEDTPLGEEGSSSNRESQESPLDRRAQSSDKLEDFSGYVYPKPENPIEYPEQPVKKSTTNGYES